MSKIHRKSISKVSKKYVYKRDDYKCLACGSTENLTIDHIIPISKGGRYTVENYQTLCTECNGFKDDMIYTFLPIREIIDAVELAISKYGETRLEKFYRLFLHEKEDIVTYYEYTGNLLFELTDLKISTLDVFETEQKLIEFCEYFVGKKCEKQTGRGTAKPFKSGKRINTIKGVIRHKVLPERFAFTFEEDDSYVECGRCIIVK